MSVFSFKQFSIDQSGCAMKINTDGVLIGALAGAIEAKHILDIGTGTGVIALMLAQRFNHAKIDAVEIDTDAAQTAGRNFNNSPFANKLALYALGFEPFFEQYPEKKYDLIVSNPPFHLNSLTSTGVKKNLARHTDADFFERLVKAISQHLTENGECLLILPLSTSGLLKDMLSANHLYLQKVIAVRSFTSTEPHREIISFGRFDSALIEEDFIIYEQPKVYSAIYQDKLRPFFTIFK
jgi:tRNA1Val (adenine37-N6)-methyltransferase